MVVHAAGLRTDFALLIDSELVFVDSPADAKDGSLGVINPATGEELRYAAQRGAWPHRRTVAYDQISGALWPLTLVRGCFTPPTLVADIDENRRLVHEEQLGPIVPVLASRARCGAVTPSAR